MSMNIKVLRENAHLTQAELAQLLHASWVSVSRWERGVTHPNRAVLKRLGRLQEVVDRIGTALTKEAMLEFLIQRHPLLRDCRPVDLLDNDYSFRDLVAFVEAAKSGDMA